MSTSPVKCDREPELCVFDLESPEHGSRLLAYAEPDSSGSGGLGLYALTLAALSGSLASVLVSSTDAGPIFVLLAGAALALFLFWLLSRRPWLVLFAALVLVLSFTLAASRSAFLVQSELEPLLGSPVEISAVVESEHKVGQTDASTLVLAGCRLLKPRTLNINGKVRLPWVKPPFPQGGRLQVRGILLRPKENSFSFSLSPRRFANSQGIYFELGQARLVGGNKVPESGPLSFQLPLKELRQKLLQLHQLAIGSELGPLLGSMVLGERACKIDGQMKLSFNRVGLSHLLAASGMNLTIILAALMLCRSFSIDSAEPARSKKSIDIWLSLLAVLGFTMLAGPSPSVNRAAIMCSLVLFSSLLFRGLPAVRALCLALLINIACDPLCVFDLGLELSYSATFGVLVLLPLVQGSFDYFFERLPTVLRLPLLQLFLRLLAVVLAAQSAVMPLQLFYFGQFSTLFLPANLLAEPLVAPITVLGFASTIFACPLLLLPPGLVPACAYLPALCLDWLSLPFLQALNALSRMLSAWSGCILTVGRPGCSQLLFFYLVALALPALQPGLSRLLRLTTATTQAYLGVLFLFFSAAFLSFFLFFSPSLEILTTSQGFIVRRAGQGLYCSGIDITGDTINAAGGPSSTLASFLKARLEPRFPVPMSSPGAEALNMSLPPEECYRIALAKDGLVILAHRPAGSRCPFEVSIYKGGARTARYQLHYSPNNGWHETGSIAFPACLPYFKFSLPVYPVLESERECRSSSCLVRFRI